MTALDFESPPRNIHSLVARIVDFDPGIFANLVGLDFVDAHVRRGDPFVIAYARSALIGLACSPGIGLGSVTALVDEGTALAVGKARPRRFVTEGAAHVAFAVHLHIYHVTLVHEFYGRSSNPRAKEPSRKCRVNLPEFRRVICDHHILALLEGLTGERVVYGSTQVEEEILHVVHVHAARDVDFHPFKGG